MLPRKIENGSLNFLFNCIRSETKKKTNLVDKFLGFICWLFLCPDDVMDEDWQWKVFEDDWQWKGSNCVTNRLMNLIIIAPIEWLKEETMAATGRYDYQEITDRPLFGESTHRDRILNIIVGGLTGLFVLVTLIESFVIKWVRSCLCLIYGGICSFYHFISYWYSYIQLDIL